jgi:hypothetical protein
MGLCCSSCLLGPCRISPFERESTKGLCGDDANLIVAKNLLRLVAGEATRSVKDLGEAVRDLDALDAKQGTRNQPPKGALKGIVQKYGLTSRVPVNRFARYLIRESQKLLSVLSEPERPSALLSSLYPEDAFPHIRRDTLLPESLITPIFDGLSQEQKESPEVQGVLWQCLKTSMVAFICEELHRDVRFLIDGECLSKIEKEALDIAEGLPADPLPVVILLFRDDDIPGEFIGRTTKELRQRLKGRGHLVPLKDVTGLPIIGREFFRKWSLPVNAVDAIAAVFSQSAGSVLGALACGFTVVSLPALPIHGSTVVEKFFSKDLKEKLGSAYVSPRGGEVLPVILEFLG